MYKIKFILGTESLLTLYVTWFVCVADAFLYLHFCYTICFLKLLIDGTYLRLHKTSTISSIFLDLFLSSNYFKV